MLGLGNMRDEFRQLVNGIKMILELLVIGLLFCYPAGLIEEEWFAPNKHSRSAHDWWI
jgi:hypothetical protein